MYQYLYLCYLVIYLFIYLFLERGREGEREGKKPQCVVASYTLPTGGLAHNPGMCPAWELNQRPFGLQAGAQSTEPHQPGHFFKKQLRELRGTDKIGFQFINNIITSESKLTFY